MREEKSSQLIQNAYSESAASYAARNWNLHLKQKFNWITRKSNRFRNKIRFQKFGSDSRTRNSKYSRASAVEGSSKASSLPSLQGPHHLSNILYFKMINLINSKHFLFWNVRLRPKLRIPWRKLRENNKWVCVLAIGSETVAQQNKLLTADTAHAENRVTVLCD